MQAISTQARLRSWLSLGYILFVCYLSLSPFSGWTDQGLTFSEVLHHPLFKTYTAFDAVANVVAYIPLGFLFALTLRSRLGIVSSTLLATLLSLAVSLLMEYAQMYLPARVSSNTDLLTNGVGGLLGAVLAVQFTLWDRVYNHLLHIRSHWFRQGKQMDAGLALLVLWVFGQMNPSLPMLGNVFITAISQQPFTRTISAPFDLWAMVAVALNLLMVGSLLLTLLRSRHRLTGILLTILVLLALIKFLAAAVLVKSWALLLWISSEAMLGLLSGMTLLMILVSLPKTWTHPVAASAALTYLVISHFLLENNSHSGSIYHWHYRHLLNYNGVAETILLIFPLLLLIHLWRTHKL